MDHKRVDKAFQVLWQQWHAAHTKFCRAAAEVEGCVAGLRRGGSGADLAASGRDDAQLFEGARAALKAVAEQGAGIVQRMYDIRAALVAGVPPAGDDPQPAATVLYALLSAQVLMAEQELQHQESAVLVLSSPDVDVAKVQTLLATLNARPFLDQDLLNEMQQIR